MMFTTSGLLILNLGLLAQALALVGPQPEGAITGRIGHLTKASTSAYLTCPGKILNLLTIGNIKRVYKPPY
jgi:hypothetical protein